MKTTSTTQSLLKMLTLTLSFVFVIHLQSCSNNGITDEPADFAKTKSFSKNESKAIQTANKLFANTRSDLTIDDINYITTGNLDWSNIKIDCDTLAYIINYANNNGFAIVTNDSHVNPILAFSETGKFDPSNEMAQLYFVDNIEAYLHNVYANNAKIDNTTSIGRYQILEEPIITTHIGPAEPYNKYIIMDHPGYNVCALSIAAAMTMSHCKKDLLYKGRYYDFTSINKNLIYGENHGQIRLPGIPDPVIPPIGWTDDVQGAVGAMSRLLADFSDDISTRYLSEFAFSTAEITYNTLEKIGFSVCDFTHGYNYKDILSMLNNNQLIFATGFKINQFYCHAWVVDGAASIQRNTNNNSLKDYYLHFNWGIYGYADGYYNSEVLEICDYCKFNITSFFGIKIEL